MKNKEAIKYIRFLRKILDEVTEGKLTPERKIILDRKIKKYKQCLTTIIQQNQ